MSKAHAIIIDDNLENLEVLARLLDVNDVSYTEVRDTDYINHALKEAGHIDVVFLDLEMPKQTGYEVLDFLKQTLASNIPIVAYSVHSNEITTAREVGFDGFIAKPLDLQLFATQLTSILNGEAVWVS